MSETEIIIRIALSFLLGGIIGAERQWRHRTAGLRTNTLVSLGSALYVILSINIDGDASPSRIASQIVSGIGFLGAGVIMKEGFTVRGLNTAATLWCSAAVGSLTGMGYFTEAVIGALAVVLAHISLRPIANLMNKRPIRPEIATSVYVIKVVCKKTVEHKMRLLLMNLIKKSAFYIKSLKNNENSQQGLTEIYAEVSIFGEHNTVLENIINELAIQNETLSVSWEVIDRNDD